MPRLPAVSPHSILTEFTLSRATVMGPPFRHEHGTTLPPRAWDPLPRFVPPTAMLADQHGGVNRWASGEFGGGRPPGRGTRSGPGSTVQYQLPASDLGSSPAGRGW